MIRIQLQKIRLFRALLLAWTVALAAHGAEPHSEPMTKLFNGINLDGWYVYTTTTKHDKPDAFKVVDGMIYVPGGKGDQAYYGGLITKDAYQNYRLTFDYKWGTNTFGERKDKSRDAGVLLHCIGTNGPGPWMTSFEFQVIEGGTGDLLLVQRDDAGPPEELICVATCDTRGNQRYFKQDAPSETFRNTGRLNWWGRSAEWKDVAGFRGAADVESPLGEWTHCEIIAANDELTYFVNGTLVNRATSLSHSKGKILFQTEGAEVWYRNIELTPLAN